VAGILYVLVVLDCANVAGPLQQVELFVADQSGLYAMNRFIYWSSVVPVVLVLDSTVD
jgi:hypothetical protein